MTYEFYRVQIKDRIQETSDTVSLVFDIPIEIKPNFSYESGQYINIKIMLDGKEERRAYSISSSPAIDDDIKITIKDIEGGKVSKFMTNNLLKGDWIEIGKPLGKFTIPKDIPEPARYVLIAAGSGITPLFSILNTALIDHPKNHVILFYSNRYEEGIIFRKPLECLVNKYPEQIQIFNFLSKPDENWNEFRGRINPAIFSELLGENLDDNSIISKKSTHFFLCGPNQFMNDLVNGIIGLGFSQNNIHKESFTTEAEPAKKAAVYQDREITLRIYGEDQKFVVESDSNVVISAQNNGVFLPYSCQIGACSTCRAMLVSGEVEMTISEGLTEDEIKRGYVLTCQAHPLSDDVILDFDY
jgi:ring-1,2-phenylacetyl-CoA epoxidase subunit PaaE